MKVNPLATSVSHHIETSQLICIADQLSGFYMMGNIGRDWVKAIFWHFSVKWAIEWLSWALKVLINLTEVNQTAEKKF